MPLKGISSPAIPYGSLIVVSGVNGFIGSHVADQTLAAGFRVRGTTRSLRRNAWVWEYFKNKYGSEVFELLEVPDVTIDGAFDSALKGASGFVHVASDMSNSTDPDVVIANAVKGVLNALRAAKKEGAGMKRFVYTSSSTAATLPKPEEVFSVTAESWNDEAVEMAWKTDAVEKDAFVVYAASKTESERAVWNWARETEPDFVINTVLPNANFGAILSPENQGYPSTARWIKAVLDGHHDSIKHIPPQYYVNVQDTARLHVIALASPTVKDERVFAFTEPFNFNDIIDVLRRQYPGDERWVEVPDQRQDLSKIEPIKRAEELLEEAYGFRFTGLEQSVKDNVTELKT
ncbi:hypothetical protein INS49_005265 [Diaporthe citri]|uniref:uncharacterized protein n=1 Tax=Diaporthe citri TaxID=83186 RepID=UPI001C8219C7|nr:uncharacterized protein INS49_005265 [Diaporthe citri]KAG6353785.1 hypothetical protein INS49_005265 [Diaporthe citri]